MCDLMGVLERLLLAGLLIGSRLQAKDRGRESREGATEGWSVALSLGSGKNEGQR